jgi:hypothetical protein
VKGKIKVKGKVGAGFKPAPTETENSTQKLYLAQATVDVRWALPTNSYQVVEKRVFMSS